MRKLVFMLFCSFSLVTFGQDKACQDFKTGNFEYVNTSYSDWKVSRTDSLQTETNTKSGLIIHSAITWISDCEFTLTCTKVSNPNLQRAVGKVFEIEIVKTKYIPRSPSSNFGKGNSEHESFEYVDVIDSELTITKLKPYVVMYSHAACSI